MYAEHLTLVYRDEPLAQYRVTYEPDHRRLLTVAKEQVLETPHQSPQPPLWTWGEDEWLPVLRPPAIAARRPRATGAVQPPLFALEEAGAEPRRARPPRRALSDDRFELRGAARWRRRRGDEARA